MRAYAHMAAAVLACYGAGLLGFLFVTATTGVWYDGLAKPPFMPPPWLFAPVWMILYGLMAAALVTIWKKDPHATDFHGWVPLFLTHLLFNAAWTVFFFGFQAILIALIDAICLFVCVLLLIFGALDIDRRAAYLLMPYGAWVFFAVILNTSIWYLN